MNLIDALMSGLVLGSSVKSDDTLVDFVVQGDGQVLIAGARWWYDPNGWADRVVVAAGELEPIPGGWRIARTDDVRISLSSPDPDERHALSQHRTATDIDRELYVRKLGELAKWAGDEFKAGIEAWTAAVNKRPVLDPFDVVRIQLEASRTVGVLRLGDPTIDVLAIDDRGDSVVAVGDPWLQSIAGQWREYSTPRPPVSDFLAWVMTQNPHGEAPLKGYQVAVLEGSLEGIAQRSLRSTI